MLLAKEAAEAAAVVVRRQGCRGGRRPGDRGGGVAEAVEVATVVIVQVAGMVETVLMAVLYMSIMFKSYPAVLFFVFVLPNFYKTLKISMKRWYDVVAKC